MSFRPIITEGFAVAEPATSFGPAPQLQWIKIVDLVVDDAYQRPVDTPTSRASIKAIATRFDWRFFAPVVVSPVVGGHFAIVDGQHRSTAAALCGIDQVPCMVVVADRAEQDAAFKAINGQVTKVGGGQIFKARLAAGDEDALRIQRIADRAGVRILFSHQQSSKVKPHETYALAGITQMVDAYGDDVVGAGLRAVRVSAGECQGYLTAGIIKPVIQCLGDNPAWVRHPDLDVALMNLDLVDERDNARIQALSHRGQTAADNLRCRISTHLEQALKPRLGRAA